jgi:hypothetical protein
MGLQPTQGHENSRSPTTLSSRPERSVVERSAVLSHVSVTAHWKLESESYSKLHATGRLRDEWRAERR